MLHTSRFLLTLALAQMWLWGSACVAIAITAGMINYVAKRPAGLAPQDRGLRRVFRLASETALPTTLAATVGGESPCAGGRFSAEG